MVFPLSIAHHFRYPCPPTLMDLSNNPDLLLSPALAIHYANFEHRLFLTMLNLFQTIFLLVLEACRVRQDDQIRFLKLQLAIMRKHLGKRNIIPTPAERIQLMEAGKQCNHAVKEVLEIVSFQTYTRWLRLTAKGTPPKKVGRKPLPLETVALIVRIAKENMFWGYKRIVGELRKLGILVSRTTIANVLRRNGLPPSRNRIGTANWAKFVATHLETMLAADFFCKKVLTWRGWVDAYVFTVIHLGSRKVYLSPATFHPNSDWLRQQIRNVDMWCQDERITPKYLVRDNDAKYSRAFDHTCKLHGLEILRTAILSPKMNSFCESAIGKIKSQCLNHFLCFGLGHLDYLLREWRHYYHTCRPHQGKGNEVLDPEFVPATGEGEVRRQKFLGGVLNHYYRDAG